ncbi:DUF4123 domain-containing protein [Serratia marcescens]|nr:DUF4123 domain-containing protein [Serratia marcescens]MBH3101459.1 DUF4123 domain-containing protein [Serratia marcescens]MBN5241920.1 DUF4123 domain-containing protein [Serratia marcescens]NSL16048.1 DUF4123 domain-containing protein [Serratia marcescens]HAV5985483.1 DUF4123 domain-containing protein [Serratia marcescens]
MNMTRIADWVNLLEQTCANIEMAHLDFIIDQCGIDFSVIPVLRSFSPPLAWQSLYQGLPEEALPDESPLLIRISLNDPQQKQWFIELAQKIQKTAPLLVLGSRWPFAILAEWLTTCTDATHEGRAGLFRYFDARIFPYLFSHILSSEQQVQLQRPALFWSWLDLDEKPALLLGQGAQPAINEKCQNIAFSDSQFESLMCICDVKLMLRYRDVPATGFTSQDERFTACFNGMLSATAEGILGDKERQDWVINTLSERPAEQA